MLCLVIRGADNVFDLTERGGGFASARQIVLAPSATGNHLRMRTAGSPVNLVTDQAATPTNQLSWTGPPPPITTLSAPAGTYRHTQRLYPAVAFIAAGTPICVSLKRGDTVVKYGSGLGRDIPLSVGDELVIESEESCQVRLIPQKAW